MTTVQTATQTSTNETGVTNMIANNLILEVTAEFKKDTSKMFYNVFKQQELLLSKDISYDGIESKTAQAITGVLVRQLHAEGAVKQFYNEEIDRSNYLIRSNFDTKLIALLGTQLSSFLHFIDKWYPLEALYEVAVFRQKFRDTSRANREWSGFTEALDNKEYWLSKVKKGLDFAIRAGLMETQELEGITYAKHSDKYIKICIPSRSVKPQLNKITEATRRKERNKGMLSTRRDGHSALSREALSFIEDQPFKVNTRLLDVIQGYLEATEEGERAKEIRDSMYIINGSKEMAEATELYSEYFSDLRGRMYHFAHYGPNPQGKDLAKALYYTTVEEMTKVDSTGYKLFMAEMFGEVIPKGSIWAEEEWILRTAANPVGAMMFGIDQTRREKQSEDGSDMPFKGFFTYIDMCFSYKEFKENGEAMIGLGFGPDGKCSGAQILSILANSKTIAEATGLVTGYLEKPLDAYWISSAEVEKLTGSYLTRPLTRNEIKTPFMAIQYGGGVDSLMGKEFEVLIRSLMIDPCGDIEEIMKIIIEGIQNALGDEIKELIDALRTFAESICEQLGTTSFQYKHLDGYKVRQKGEANIVIHQTPFIVNYGVGQGAIFGNINKGTSWTLPALEDGELQLKNFCYFFPVHFIQGLDALMAKKAALGAKKEGIRGWSSIHDQFRSHINDAALIRRKIMPLVYKDMFIDNNILQHLASQFDTVIDCDNPIAPRNNVVTKEILMAEDSYFFE